MRLEAQMYLDRIRRPWGYVGVYPPGRQVRLGESGTWHDGQFLADRASGVQAAAKVRRAAGGPLVLTSGGDVRASIDIGAADARGQQLVTLKLSFSRPWTVFVHAHATTLACTGPQRLAGDDVAAFCPGLERGQAPVAAWVSALVEARTLTVAVARSAGASLRLQGLLPVGRGGAQLDALDLRAFAAVHRSGAITLFGPLADATPLIRLRRSTPAPSCRAHRAALQAHGPFIH